MEKNTNRKRIIFAVVLLVIMLFTGITGYMLIDDYPFIDSLYMTIITVSSVGFGEVHGLSVAGKIFTSFLILFGLGTLAYVISIITSIIFEGQLNYFIRGYKKKSRRNKMENHVIICGYGRNGQQAVEELIAHKHSFVVIEESHELVLDNMDKNIRFIEGNATEDETLIKAGIKTAKALITTLPNDTDNLFVVLTARSLNKDMTIISRASSKSSEKKLKIAGVSNVVMPEKVGGAHMATLVTSPDVIEFLEHVSVRGDAPTNLVEIICSQLPKEHLNKSIYEIGVRKKTGANIIGFKTPDGEYIINPTPDTKVIPNSKLFVLGTPEQIIEMKEIFRAVTE
ncbi:MAG: NAD-binding protein [Bacteroidales bacterium]|nr:NAD-binding protein [Bacteroidales bacterium]